MRFSHLAAPLACSALLHLVALQFGWEVFASSTRAATPWRSPGALRVSMVQAPSPVVPVPSKPRPSVAPLVPEGSADLPARRKPRALAPSQPVQAPPPATPFDPDPVPPAAPAAPAPALPDDRGFVDAGGVDEPARLLREPDFSLPGGATVLNWRIHFDLLIDEQGKVVRVDNVSDGAPRELIGAVLAAFYTTPFEPARLAGAPVAVRQRFEVGPEGAPAAKPEAQPSGVYGPGR